MKSEKALRRLRASLIEARESRMNAGRNVPSVDYCPICDEYVVRLWDEEEGEYPRLDCWDEHHEVHESHDRSEITEWIGCLNFVLGEGVYDDKV